MYQLVTKSKKRRERRKRLESFVRIPLPSFHDCLSHVHRISSEMESRDASDLQTSPEMYFRKKFIRSAFYYRLDTPPTLLNKERCINHCIYLIRLSGLNPAKYSDAELQAYVGGMIYRKQIVRLAREQMLAVKS